MGSWRIGHNTPLTPGPSPAGRGEPRPWLAHATCLTQGKGSPAPGPRTTIVLCSSGGFLCYNHRGVIHEVRLGMAGTPPSRSNVDPGPPVLGQPAWGVALLFPLQGSWTETDYLGLDAGRLVEFSDGCVEVLEMPTKEHQRLVRILFQLLSAHVTTHNLGEVFFAPLPVRLWSQKYREPDLVFLRHGRPEYQGVTDGADLVVEVVSEGEANRHRDLVTKRAEYAQAGIPEYWIVDPRERTLIVLSGLGKDYSTVSVYRPGEVARSSTIADLQITLDQVFD